MSQDTGSAEGFRLTGEANTRTFCGSCGVVIEITIDGEAPQLLGIENPEVDGGAAGQAFTSVVAGEAVVGASDAAT